MTNLGEVARRAGVSRSTASRVVNNRPGVSAEARERVVAAIRELNYTPHSVARSLATRKTHILGFLVPQPMTRLFSDHYYPLLLQGVVQAATAHGYRVMLTLWEDGSPARGDSGWNFANDYAEGVIVAVSVPSSDAFLPELVASGVPFVCVGRWPGDDVSWVDVDNSQAAYSATVHLLRLGYRRIGTITGPRAVPVSEERLRGYRRALEEHSLPPNEDLVCEADFTEAGGIAAMHRLLRAGPDAVFVQSDTMAAGAYLALRQAGLRVPDDVALVGFDDLPLAAHLDPPLTTVRQPVHLMGQIAVELLLERLGSPPGNRTPRQVLFPTELVVRESCGSCRRGGPLGGSR